MLLFHFHVIVDLKSFFLLPQVQSLCSEFANYNERKHPKGKGTGGNQSIFFKWNCCSKCSTNVHQYFCVFHLSLSFRLLLHDLWLFPVSLSSFFLEDCYLTSFCSFLFSPCMTRILLVCLSLLSILALRPPPGFLILCFLFSFLLPPSVVFLLPFAHPSVVSSPLYSLHPVCVISNCIIIFSLYPVLNLG